MRRQIRDFARRDEATATMEFVITFPVIMMLFMGAFETSMIMTRQVMLERTLDLAVRELRLANGVSVTDDQIRSAICNNTGMLPDCATLLTIDLQRVDRTTYAMPSDQDLCVDRAASATPLNSFVIGADDDFMLIRACMIVDRIFPFSGYGLNLTRDDSGGLHMMASAVFVNEPDSSVPST